MIFRTITDDDGAEVRSIGVRQSWVGNALMCLERGRLDITSPEFRSGSDATVLGTAMHSAIEQVLLGNCGLDGLGDAAIEGLETAMNRENWKYTSVDPADMRPLAIAMSEAWGRDVYPQVELGGQVEYKFNVPLSSVMIGDEVVRINLEGTMDYVSPSGVLWDWKSAKRKYNQRELQKQNIQSQVYALAAIKSGLASDWPVRFNFGVMIRKKQSEGSITPIVRTHRHGLWIERQVVNLVSAALRMGINHTWPQIDQGYLCNSTWCSHWSQCKGAHLIASDEEAPTE